MVLIFEKSYVILEIGSYVVIPAVSAG